jgi:hypothetical protein
MEEYKRVDYLQNHREGKTAFRLYTKWPSRKKHVSMGCEIAVEKSKRLDFLRKLRGENSIV